MRTLDEVIERDEKLFEQLKKTFPDSASIEMHNAPYPKTFTVVFSLIAKMGFLKTAIIDMCEIDNPYAQNVLYRSFIEHYLKANAIFFTAIKERNDSFAEQYMKLGGVEGFDYIKACEAAGLVEQPHANSLKKKVAEAHNLTEKEVRSLAEPFQYKSLVKRIKSLTGMKDDKFLSSIIPTYSELSSYVHGGPDSTRDLINLSNEEQRHHEMVHVADMVVSMFYFVESFLRTTHVQQAS